MECAITREEKAGCPDEVEGMSWRASAYKPGELDALTKDLPQPLNVPCAVCLRAHAWGASRQREKWRTPCKAGSGLRSTREATDELAKVAEEGANRMAELDAPRCKTARTT